MNGIVTTREQRRELARQNAKMPRELRLVPRDEWPFELQGSRIQRVWLSRDFLVQEWAEQAPVLVRLSVLRTTLDPKAGRWVDGITWDGQAIKSELWVMRELATFAWRWART